MISLLTSKIPHRLLLATILFTGCMARAEDPKVMAVVKLPPVKTLSDKVVGLMREVLPKQQAEFYPIMAFGAFGYPKFPGVSTTEGVTIFFFEPLKGEPIPFVVLSKMDKDAPMRKSLSIKSKAQGMLAMFMGPGLVSVEREGWTLFSNKEASLEYAENVDYLSDLADSISGFDITARIFIGPEKAAQWAEQTKQTLADQHVVLGRDESDPSLLHKQLVVDYLYPMFANLQWAQMGLDINAEAVQLGTSVKALKDTPEAALLSAVSNAPTPIADYLEVDVASFVQRYNPEAINDYYKVLFTRAMGIATPSGKAWLEKADVINRELLKVMATTGAGTDNVDPKNQVSANIFTSTIDNALIEQSFHFYIEELLPYLMDTFADADVAKSMANISLKTNVEEVQGKQVGLIENTYEKVEIDWSSKSLTPQTVTKTDRVYYVVLNGCVVVNTSLSDLKKIAERIVQKQPVPDSVGSRIQLKSGQLFEGEMDIATLVSTFATGLEPESEVARQALDELANSELEPLRLSAEIGDGQGKYLLSAPVSTIRKISETYRQFQQSEKEMQPKGGSTPKVKKSPAE